MSFIDNLFISIFSSKVGEDEFGNKYYDSRKRDYLGRTKRQIIFKKDVNASEIPPMWHAWLHHMIEDIPGNNKNSFGQHELSPKTIKPKPIYEPKTNNVAKNGYSKWQPPQ